MDVIIIGAGGHSKVVIDILKENNQFNIIGLLDDDENMHGKLVLGIKVLGNIESIKKYDPKSAKFIITIGNNLIRRELFNKISDLGYMPINAISKHAVISQYAKLGNGLIINSGVKIHPHVHIGDNAIIGMNATISHDSIIGDNSHVSPGVHITGGVNIGPGVDIGTGAVIIPNIHIGENSIIGAGAVVTKDIENNLLAVGVPARPIKKL